MIPPDGRKVRQLVPGAELVELPELGHLAHEEDLTASRRCSQIAPPLGKSTTFLREPGGGIVAGRCFGDLP